MNEPIRINKGDVEDYVRSLDSQCQEIYRMAEAARVGYRDTLDDEFQILCEILDVFSGYALRRKNILSAMPESED